MNQTELYETVKSGVDILELQSLRSDIRRHTGLYVPTRPTEVESWYENKKSVLTRKVNPENDSASSTSTSDGETETTQSDS
jgi:hypothetical protein